MTLDASRLRKRLPPPVQDGHPAIDAPSPAPGAAPRRRWPAAPAAPAAGAPHLDGRSLRATGRTIQLNLKVAAGTKARLVALAGARGQLMAEVFEDALDALEREADR